MGKRERIKKQRQRTEAQSGHSVPQPSAKELEPIVIQAPPGMEKMSDLLKELASPWLPDVRDEDDVLEILNAAALAWNLTLLPEAEQKAVLEKYLGRLSLENQKFLDELILRKEKLFPLNKRVISDVWLEHGLPGLIEIKVMSSLDPNDAGKLMLGGGLKKKSWWRR